MKKLILFSILILLAACGKPRTIKIIAKNAATGVAFAGLSYIVQSSRTTSSGEKYRSEAEGVLNENGEATVQLKQKKGRSYSIVVKEPENICYTKEYQQYFDSPFDVNGTFTFEFAECTLFKFKLNNINCNGVSDIISYNRIWLNDNNIPQPVVLTGCINYDGDFFSLPEGQYKYEWDVTKNGVLTHYDSLFTLTKNQNYTFTINY